MAKVEDPRLPGWDEPPLPLKPQGSRPTRALFQRLSLRHIMISLVYFAILFWVGKQAMESEGVIERVFLGVMIGLGLCAIGFWAAMRMPRFSFIGWIVFVLGYMTITGATTTFLAIPTLPILIGAIVYLSRRRRSNDQDGLLWVLAVASDRGMPLSPGVQAYSNQVTGIYEVWTTTLADLLARGATLPEALDQLPRLLPRWDTLLVRAGHESGNLALGLREAIDVRERQQPILRAIAGRMAYLGWVLAVSAAITSFILYFIMPKFEAIFKDFGVELPEVTKSVIRGSHFVVDYSWVGMLAFLVALGYGFVRMLGTGDGSLPIIDRLLSRRHSIMILRTLGVVVSAGRPIAPALYALAQWYPTGWVRKKLTLAAADASQGIDWVEALRENSLISSSDVGVLNSAQRAGNLGWALRELAETGERRWAYRLQAWTQILFLIAMLAVGGLVLLMALAYFSPLIKIISRLAE